MDGIVKLMRDLKERLIAAKLSERLKHSPAVLLDGPRAVGKTTLATGYAKTKLNLEIPSLRQLAQQQPDELLAQDEPIFIDEWHQAPEVLGAVRRAVDLDRRPGRFLLAGSGATSVPHSGVGRVSSLRIRPFTLQERGRSAASISLMELVRGDRPSFQQIDFGLPDYAIEIVRSGFPAFVDLSESEARAELEAYLQIMIASDTESHSVEVRRPQLLRNWLRAYASSTATSASLENIRGASGLERGSAPSKVTGLSYFELMSQLRIIEPVAGFSTAATPLKRVVSSPKHQLVDPGLSAALLGVGSKALLSGFSGNGDRLMLSQLFDALVTLHLRVFCDLYDYQLYHYREWDGRREVDAILESPTGELSLIEFKLSNPETGQLRHINHLADQLGSRVVSKIVISAGQQVATLSNGVAQVPLAALSI